MNLCKYSYNIFMTVIFIIIFILMSLYFRCFCLSGDDLMLILACLDNFRSSDHGNIAQDKILFILNYQLPILFKIHPQVFIFKSNIYVYALLYTVMSYLMVKSSFLFNKKNLLFPLLLLIFSSSLFAISMNISVDHYTYWLKESCSFLRFTLAPIFAFVLLCYLLKLIFLHKIKNINKKNLFTAFLLGFLCANASEFNSFVYITYILLLILILNIHIFEKKIHIKVKSTGLCKLLITTLSGLITGALLIISDPRYQQEIWAERTQLSFDDKNFITLLNCYYDEIFAPNILFLLCFVILIFVLRKYYRKTIYKYIFTTSFSLFISCNLFYIISYYLTYELNYIFPHGDIKILLISLLIFNALFLFGFLIRKMKNRKFNIVTAILIVAVFTFFMCKYRDTTIKQIKIIRNANITERTYLAEIEKEFLKQYYDNKYYITLPFDTSINIDYRNCYIYEFLPLYNKSIKRGSYTINWTEE